MRDIDAAMWRALSEAYAFLGNSLLSPMTLTEPAGIDPAFWEAFPRFSDEGIAAAADACAAFARDAYAAEAARIGDAPDGGAARAERASDEDGVDEDGVRAALIERVSVEYTKLFVGPPVPAAAPWETMYRGSNADASPSAPGAKEGAAYGFGEPTFQMRSLLRGIGLELSNENRQYEDHMGIELLYLSQLCRLRAQGTGEGGPSNDDACAVTNAPDVECGDGAASGAKQSPGDACADGRATADGASSDTSIAVFIDAHPLGWIGSLRSRVDEAFPGGYVSHILALAEALLAWQKAALDR